MLFLGKSAIDNNLQDKINKGADGIELYLSSEFLSDNYNFREDINLSLIEKYPIYAVHCPLNNGAENFETVFGFNVFIKVAEFAEYLSNIYKRNVIVVVHLSTSVDTLKKLGLYNNLINAINGVLQTYPSIEIAIENIANCYQDKNGFCLYNCYLDNVKLAIDCNNKRVGTVLDTCHVIQDANFYNYLKDFLYFPYNFKYDLHTHFKENKDVIKLIHLSNCYHNGLEENHGLMFDSKNMSLLEDIFNYYDIYNYNCPITIEVMEKNYSNAINFEETLKNCRRILLFR